MTWVWISQFDDDAIRTLHWNKFAAVEPNYSGITYTHGRLQPYTVWHHGQIYFYSHNQKDAHRAHIAAKATTKKSVDDD